MRASRDRRLPSGRMPGARAGGLSGGSPGGQGGIFPLRMRGLPKLWNTVAGDWSGLPGRGKVLSLQEICV